MSEKILITSALPYANGPIHFGHIAGAYLPADCYARFQRMKKNDVLFLCGSDEYGVAVTMSAEKAGRTPQQQVELFHQINKNFFEKLEISFDHYSRTTWEGHKETVQQFFIDLYKNGYIETKVEDHLFSEKENRFLADRYVRGICPKCGFENARGDECPKCGGSFEANDLINPVSALTSNPLAMKPTRHWFMRFDLFKERLIDWMKDKNWKPNVLHFARSYIDDLRARAITRDSSWGIEVPLKEAEGKVFYVWFDAPIGYISAAKEWAVLKNEPELWKNYWLDSDTKLINFIGKDNIPFHAVFFPAMIMGQNIPYKLPDEIPANEFLLLEGRQFSKSEGWTIDTGEFFSKYSVDQIRYYLAANAPETSDSEFTWKDFQAKCNQELLAKFGNFVNRTLVFANKHLSDQTIQAKDLNKVDLDFLKNIQRLKEQAEKAYSHFQLRKACQVLMELSQLGNVYFDEKKPWKLSKDPNLEKELITTLNCCLQCILVLALIAYPIIPKTAKDVFLFLNKEIKSWDEIGELESFSFLKKPHLLFRKIEDQEIEEEIIKLQSGVLK